MPFASLTAAKNSPGVCIKPECFWQHLSDQSGNSLTLDPPFTHGMPPIPQEPFYPFSEHAFLSQSPRQCFGRQGHELRYGEITKKQEEPYIAMGVDPIASL